MPNRLSYQIYSASDEIKKSFSGVVKRLWALVVMNVTSETLTCVAITIAVADQFGTAVTLIQALCWIVTIGFNAYPVIEFGNPLFA